MSVDQSFARGALTTIRTALGVSGALSLIVGLLIVFWPGRTAEVAVAIIAVWAVAAGLVYAGVGILVRVFSGWVRVGYVVLGALFVIAGVVALVNLAAATVGFTIVLGVIVGALWIVEGIVTLTTLGASGSKGWAIFSGVLSIVAGLILLFTPMYVGLLWVFLGIALIVLGIVGIVRAVTIGRGIV